MDYPVENKDWNGHDFSKSLQPSQTEQNLSQTQQVKFDEDNIRQTSKLETPNFREFRSPIIEGGKKKFPEFYVPTSKQYIFYEP